MNNDEQLKWLGFIGDHMRKNLVIDMEDFSVLPIFEQRGGRKAAERVFGRDLAVFVDEINYAVAA